MEEGFYVLHPSKKTVRARLNRYHDRCLVFRHSHIAITDYHLGDNKEFEKCLSVWDEMAWKYKRMAGYYVSELKEFRLPRGFDLELLSRHFKGYRVVIDNDDAIRADKVEMKLTVPPKDDAQRMIITFLCNQEEFKKNSRYTGHMVDANTGLGKAMPDDTLVARPCGWTPLGDLEPGDTVFTPDGRLACVLAVYPQSGTPMTYQFTLANGFTTRCNYDHMWKVRVDGGDWELLLTSDLLELIHTGHHVWLPHVDKQIQRLILDTMDVDEPTGPSIGFDEDKEIISIEPIGPSKQRCILIDDPNHLFVTRNFIQTHNTYCSVAGSCFMSARTIIIVPIGKLLGQWKESYLKFTNLKEKDILIVQGSKMCQKILNGDYEDVKIFIFSLDTIISFRDRYGDMDTIEMFEKTGAYLKVFDECHLDMKGVNVIEALCNTKQTIYASASPGRSQKKENWIFHRLYRHVPRFGSKFTVQEEKYLDIMIVPYRWTPTAAQVNRLINRRTKWLNANLYEKELFNASREQTGEFFTKLNAMLTWSSKVVKKENKILIMCSTVEGTKTMLDEAEKVFPGECARYHGGLKESEKEAALKYRVICATGQSLGTGADIKGIQHVYNVSTYGNWINANQKPGRARKLEDGTQVVYIELVNFGYMKTMRQYEKRRPELIKKTRSGQLMLIQ